MSLPNEMQSDLYIAYSISGEGFVYSDRPKWVGSEWVTLGNSFGFCQNCRRPGQLWRFNCARSLFVQLEDNIKIRENEGENFTKDVLNKLRDILGD